MAVGSIAGSQVFAPRRGPAAPECRSCEMVPASGPPASPAYAPDSWLGGGPRGGPGGGPEGNLLGDLRELLGNLGGNAPPASPAYPPAASPAYPAYPPVPNYPLTPRLPIAAPPPVQPVAPSGPFTPPAQTPAAPPIAWQPPPAQPPAWQPPRTPVQPAPQRPPLPPPAYAPRPAAPVAPAPATGVSPEIQAVVDATNRERARYGLRPLTASPALNRVAQNRSADMARRRYFDHTDPDGRDPFWHLRNAGIRYMAGAENIAMGQRSAAEVVTGWMNSPGHRANILNGRLGHIGVGLARDSRGTPYWTQIFTD